MLKINKNQNKYLARISLFAILSLQIFPFSASALTLPESLAENVYSSTVLNAADNDVNGAANKQKGPSVEINFSGSMQPGSKVVAKAVPGFFDNYKGYKDLYYTWFLQKAGCEEKDSGVSVNNPCNLDGNDKIDGNDWKIAATRIMIKGDFDKNEEGIDYSDVNKDSGYEAVPKIDKDDGWRVDTLRDGDEYYKENSDDAQNCYIQTPKTGSIYELRETKENFENSCPSGYHRSCVAKKPVNCDIYNIDYDPLDPDSSYSVPNPQDFNACVISSKGDDADLKCDIANVSDLKNFRSSVVCNKEGEVPICVKDENLLFKDGDDVKGIIFNINPGDTEESKVEKICTDVLGIDEEHDLEKVFFKEPFKLEQAECTDIQKWLVNGTKDDFGNTLIEGQKTLMPTCTFEKGANLCKHLFPKFPKSKIVVDGREIDLSDDVSGDGEFTRDEKIFWGADPSTDSTNGKNKDEEVVVGLGMDTFEWTYNIGDKLGVVVEGGGTFLTRHADLDAPRTWAFSGEKCKILDKLESENNIMEQGDNDTRRGFYTETIKGFLVAEVDLEDCINEDSLVEPDEDGSASLKVQLSATPNNPINDPTGKGDILEIISSPINTANPESLLYKWSVQISDSGSIPPGDDTVWNDITDELLSGGSFSQANIEGLGKDKLSIKLNIKDVEDLVDDSYEGIFYLRVKAKITSTGADSMQTALGITDPIRVREVENQIRIYPVTATSDGMLNINKGLSGQSLEICSDNEGQIRCYVGKNSIFGLEVPDEDSKLSNFSWTVNGNEFLCSSSISTECRVGGNKLFVPILGNEGEAVDVVVKALNEQKEEIELSRHFIIAPEQLQIASFDPNSYCGINCLDSASICPKYLGHYNMINGYKKPDCSWDVWETRQGNIVTLGTLSQAGFEWAVDGQIISDFQDKNQIKLEIGKFPGDSYNIGLSTRFRKDDINLKNNIRRALSTHWGVSPEDSIEENKSANIQINVVDGISQTAAAKNDNYFASLISYLPTQTMFLFKIAITSFTLLLTMSILFAILPKTALNEIE